MINVIKRTIVIVILIAVSFILNVKAEASNGYILTPIVKYDFKNENIGKDSVNNFDLTTVGNPVKGTHGVVLDGYSYLYSKSLNELDLTEQLDSFTITLWAKEDSVKNTHRFMLGTGCANSTTGFGMGFYVNSSSYIVPNGAAPDYHLNMIVSKSDNPGSGDSKYETSTKWNLFTIMAKEGKLSYGVNGNMYTSVYELDMETLLNKLQTLTIGAVCYNDGYAAGNLFVGEIADVRIYNDFLSNDEFQTIYNNGIGGEDQIYRSTNISAIKDSILSSEIPYDFETKVIKMFDSNIMNAIEKLDIKVILNDNSVVNGDVVISKIEKISETEAMVTCVPTVSGIANTEIKNIKVKVVLDTSIGIYANTTFTDHMVLQRNSKVKIFGYGGIVGESVEVSFNGQNKSGIVTEEGWAVYLDEMPATNVGSPLVITYKNQEIVFEDVVVGEVFLCSGQSNMDMTLQYCMNKNSNALKEFSEFDNYDKIRVLKVPYGGESEPQLYETPRSSWQICGTAENSKEFSAYALAAASHYQAILGNDIPVGIITASVGGSVIEEWLDAESMENLNSYASEQGKVDSRYYNSFIHNLGGYTLSGILWYQGCSNSQFKMIEDYKKQFNAYVNKYREMFENDKLTIIVQQLVQFDSWVEVGYMRQTQWDFMNFYENIYTVCGIDTGYMDPIDGIHPADKWILGERVAAALALAKGIKREEFAVKNAYGLSPEILSAEVEKTSNGMIITFNTTDDRNLKASGTVTGFQIKVDGIWQDVDAQLIGGIVTIQTNYNNLSGIRYNFINGYDTQYDLTNFVYKKEGVFVYNKENLPLAPSSNISFTFKGENGGVNLQTFKGIIADTSNVKMSYYIGEELDLTGLIINEVYDNSLYDYDSILSMTDLDNYYISVTDSLGNEVTGEFSKTGVYKVKLVNGESETFFDVFVLEKTEKNENNENNENPEPPVNSGDNGKKGCNGSLVPSFIGLGSILVLLPILLFIRKKGKKQNI